MAKKYSKRQKKTLGLNQKITRKDFIKTTLVGSGAMLLNMSSPAQAGKLFFPNLSNNDWNGYGGVGDYKNSNGNTWEVANAAHEIRDEFPNTTKSIQDTGEYFDIVVVGAGFSGLGAAYTFLNESEEKKCLVLDNHPIFGGEAKRNEFDVNGYRLYGPQGSNDFIVPQRGTSIGNLWEDLRLPFSFDFADWEGSIKIGKENYLPMYFNEKGSSLGYYFKENDSIVKNPWEDNLARTPWPQELKDSYIRMMNNQEKPNAGKVLSKWLDSITYKDFLVNNLNLDPRVCQYVDPVLAVSAFGHGSDVISAYAAFTLGMPGINSYIGGNQFENYELYSFPGGNAGLARHFVKKLIPNAFPGNSFEEILTDPINFESLDQIHNKVSVRLSSTVVDVQHENQTQDGKVSITYIKNGKKHRIKAGGVVMASGGWVNRRVVSDIPQNIQKAYDTFNHAPILSVNVALTNWRFLEKLGISGIHWFDDFGFFCNIRKPMIVGDHSAPLHPDKPIVLTFYIPFYYPGLKIKDQGITARHYLFATRFSTIELQIRERLTKMFSRAGFDPKKDIAGIITNRWGHAFICPQPGFYFGKNGEPAPRDTIQNGFGKIAFAHSELDGHQNWVSAFNHGQRGMRQLISG
jgi:spermidine dehydrogenase